MKCCSFNDSCVRDWGYRPKNIRLHDSKASPSKFDSPLDQPLEQMGHKLSCLHVSEPEKQKDVDMLACTMVDMILDATKGDLSTKRPFKAYDSGVRNSQSPTRGRSRHRLTKAQRRERQVAANSASLEHKYTPDKAQRYAERVAKKRIAAVRARAQAQIRGLEELAGVAAAVPAHLKEMYSRGPEHVARPPKLRKRHT